MTTHTCRLAVAAGLLSRLACVDIQQSGFLERRPLMARMAASLVIAGLGKKWMRPI